MNDSPLHHRAKLNSKQNKVKIRKYLIEGVDEGDYVRGTEVFFTQYITRLQNGLINDFLARIMSNGAFDGGEDLLTDEARDGALRLPNSELTQEEKKDEAGDCAGHYHGFAGDRVRNDHQASKTKPGPHNRGGVSERRFPGNQVPGGSFQLVDIHCKGLEPCPGLPRSSSPRGFCATLSSLR